MYGIGKTASEKLQNYGDEEGLKLRKRHKRGEVESRKRVSQWVFGAKIGRLELRKPVYTDGYFGKLLWGWLCKCRCGQKGCRGWVEVPKWKLYKQRAWSCGAAPKPKGYTQPAQGTRPPLTNHGKLYGTLRVGGFLPGIGWRCTCEKCAMQVTVRFSRGLRVAGKRHRCAQ